MSLTSSIMDEFCSQPEFRGVKWTRNCPKCRRLSECCSKCLREEANAKDWLETHRFVYDSGLQEYHNDDHDNFKQLKYREPDEFPLLYYGVELEVEFGDSVEINGDPFDSAPISRILERFSEITGGLFVYEEDSSLEHGVELISRPMSYRKWISDDVVEALENGFSYLIEQGAYINQPSSNGLHIHVSTAFFDKVGDDARSNFEWQFQQFQKQIEVLGRRQYTSYCRGKKDALVNRLTPCDDGVLLYGIPIKEFIIAKGGHIPLSDHSIAVTESGKTLEARVFKSTVRVDTLLATIEIVRAFCHAAREDDVGKSLDELLHSKDTKYLDAYLQRRRMEAKKQGQILDLKQRSKAELKITKGDF